MYMKKRGVRTPVRELSFILNAAEDGRRVGRLVLSLAKVSRHGYAALKKRGGVLLDGRPARADERARAGQTLTVLIDPAGEEDAVLTPLSGGLRVLFEDDDYLVLDKPAPMAVTRSRGKPGPTVQQFMEEAGLFFRPVNRLDKGTSGLMLCARSSYAQQRAQKLLHTDSFIREYLAVAQGEWAGEGVIDLPLIKESETSVRRVPHSDGKPCKTRYRVLMSGKGRSLVRLRLLTGRTHQIRAHLAAVGHPITGDYLYGEPDPALPGRFALHSALIAFAHPLNGETLTFESPLPEELVKIMPGPG